MGNICFFLHVSGEINHEVGMILGLHIERRWFHLCIEGIQEASENRGHRGGFNGTFFFRFTGKTIR